MTVRYAIGVGCRRACEAAAVVDLIREALGRLASGRPTALYTLEAKADDPALLGAAAALGLRLVPLPRPLLDAAMAGVRTPSAAAEATFGVASVSEAAALAGAGRGATLVLPRIAAGGATCAVAREHGP